MAELGVTTELVQSQLRLLRRVPHKQATMPPAVRQQVPVGPGVPVPVVTPTQVHQVHRKLSNGGLHYPGEHHTTSYLAASEPSTPGDTPIFGASPQRYVHSQPHYGGTPTQDAYAPMTTHTPVATTVRSLATRGRPAGSASPSPIRTAGTLALDAATPTVHRRNSRHDSTPQRTARNNEVAAADPAQEVHQPSLRSRAVPRRGEDVVDEKEYSRVSSSGTTAGSTTTDNSIPPSPSSPMSACSRGMRATGRRDEGAQYLSLEELPPFGTPPEERFVNDVVTRLGCTDDWAEQFKAIDDARRLARHAPRVVLPNLRRLMAKLVPLMESLRSALAKNALRCTGEFFTTFGRKLDSEIETSVPVILRRAADTNAFIAEEAEVALREVCRAASEARLLTQLLAGAGNRRAEIRARSAWGLAMLAQRHLTGRGGPKGLDLRAIVDAATKAVSDASADVRQCGRFIASVLVAGKALKAVEDGPAKTKLQASVLQGTDPALFDAFDLEAIRAAPLGSTSASTATGATRLFSAGGDGRSSARAKAAAH